MWRWDDIVECARYLFHIEQILTHREETLSFGVRIRVFVGRECCGVMGFVWLSLVWTTHAIAHTCIYILKSETCKWERNNCRHRQNPAYTYLSTIKVLFHTEHTKHNNSSSIEHTYFESLFSRWRVQMGIMFLLSRLTFSSFLAFSVCGVVYF